MEDNRPIEDILDTIGDQQARAVLAAVSEEPASAKDLAEELDYSVTTVYRRLDLLKEHDLITEKTLVADDGNHYSVFECNFNSTVISLDGDKYDVKIFREGNVPDRFSQLWDDLSTVE